ncbi:MAG: hypothetical protein GY705_21050 [Bacteroidetes bacterium]|nr:hypothetical protein [Bacteroidota bacterium]
MKKLILLLGLSLLIVLGGTTFSSCSRKTGCPMNEKLHTKPDRKGGYAKKRGKSNLFPKDMRKN